MGMRIGVRRTAHRSWAVGSVVLLLVVAACGGSAGSADSGEPGNGPADTDAASYGAAVPGGWSGTITFHAVMDQSKDDTSTSGEGTYQETLVTHSVTQADVTDSFTVTGNDPDDIEFGIHSVDLSGSVANSGTSLERYTFVSDKHNALGCHWTNETGGETKGSWSHDATSGGSISFNDDGSYYIRINAGSDPVTGETLQSPELPKRLWDKNTILEGAAADCPGPGPELTTTGGPAIEWASSILGAYDSIDGTMDASAPGAVVDGSKTFKIDLPEATLTVTWHLVHDGPITLPHS